MNNIEYNQLINASMQYKNIALSMSIYMNLLSYNDSNFTVIMDSHRLRYGLYGYLNKCNICFWGSFKTPFDSTRISNSNEYDINKINWSIPLELSNLDKLIKLHAFW